MMLSVIASREALKAASWAAPTAECAVTWGTFAGVLVGREPLYDGWEVLHVPSLAVAKALLTASKVSGKVQAATAAKAAAGAAWPTVDDGDGKTSPAGVPHIAGGAVPLELEHGVQTWESKDGKAISDGRF